MAPKYNIEQQDRNTIYKRNPIFPKNIKNRTQTKANLLPWITSIPTDQRRRPYLTSSVILPGLDLEVGRSISIHLHILPLGLFHQVLQTRVVPGAHYPGPYLDLAVTSTLPDASHGRLDGALQQRDPLLSVDRLAGHDVQRRRHDPEPDVGPRSRRRVLAVRDVIPRAPQGRLAGLDAVGRPARDGAVGAHLDGLGREPPRDEGLERI